MADDPTLSGIRPFADYPADLATAATREGAVLAEEILNGPNRMRHANGGVTANGTYYPPEPVID